MATEKRLQQYCKTLAKGCGVGFYKLECVGRRGFPDVMLIKGAKIVFVELKSPSGTGRLSALQTHRIAELRELGATVLVVDSFAGVDDVIKSFS